MKTGMETIVYTVAAKCGSPASMHAYTNSFFCHLFTYSYVKTKLSYAYLKGFSSMAHDLLIPRARV